jgi:hypothetical protein
VSCNTTGGGEPSSLSATACWRIMAHGRLFRLIHLRDPSSPV